MKSMPTFTNWVKRFAPVPASAMLPLLGKELVEQAARRRTYIVRVVYALMLFLAGLMFYYQIVGQFSGYNQPFALLGKGGQLFTSIVMLQFFGVYLFMPAMTCSVITVEKERGSLSLLLLTKLGGWTIILEKYLGRIIPMFSFLLLSLPMLVIAYSMGGVSRESIASGIWFLALTTLQVGALAIMCSTFFRSTVGSFMATFLLGIVMLFWLPLLYASLGMLNGPPDWIPFSFVTPALFLISAENGNTGWDFALDVAGTSIPILIQTLLFLVLARVFLIRRAFLPPTNLFLKIFKWLDEFFHWLNDNPWTKGKVLISDKVALNTIVDPVAWRETTKTSLGSFRYLTRLFILIEAPIVTIGLLLISLNGSHEPLTFLMFLLWIVSTLIVAVKATTLVCGERAHETLDVLLTTPMRSSEIIQQKFRGVMRLMLVLSVPLLTTLVLKTAIVQVGVHSWRGGWGSYGYRNMHWSLYLLSGILSVVIYLPMVAWLSLFIGIRVRSQSKAIFATMAALVGWCALPVFLIVLIFEISGGWNGASLGNLWLLLSPATIIVNSEVFELENTFQSGWLAVILNSLLYGLVAVLLRVFCLTNLDSRLGRSSGSYE